jgi:hypothetical protein
MLRPYVAEGIFEINQYPELFPPGPVIISQQEKKTEGHSQVEENCIFNRLSVIVSQSMIDPGGCACHQPRHSIKNGIKYFQ